MSKSEQEIEKKIQEKNLNAPRLTPALIDDAIKSKDFHVFGETCLTVCCLTLRNGFTVTGESACASPENFNAEIGQEIAFEQARNKVWALEGYLLKQKLFDTPVSYADRIKLELSELAVNTGKINAFIQSEAYEALDAEVKEAMLDQSVAMMGYFNALKRRIELL